jgi:hypothetical protein
VSNPALKIQLLRKLWAHLTPRETIGLMSPDRIQRLGLTLGDIRRQELSNIHHLERQLSELRRGYLDVDEEGRLVKSATASDVRDVAYSSIIDFSSESSDAVDNAPTLGDMLTNARKLNEAESVGRLLRLQKVYLLTERIILGMNPSEIDKGMLDPRWFSRWRIGVSEIPNGAMQQMWARILVNELMKPGSNSLRALDVLAALSLEEAELINRLSGYVLGDFVSRTALHATEDQADPEWLASLEELGILRGVSGRTCNKTLRSQQPDGFHYEIMTVDKRIGFQGIAHKEELMLPAYLLTVMGQDIVGLFSAPLDERYFSHVTDDLKARGVEVTVVDRTSSAADRKAS